MQKQSYNLPSASPNGKYDTMKMKTYQISQNGATDSTKMHEAILFPLGIVQKRL